MKRMTFHCETITPMFLAGADGRTPELRPPSIKGMLRFWWRAIRATEVESLREDEAYIFGSSNEKIGRSKFRLLLRGEIKSVDTQPLPHHSGDKKSFSLPAIGAGNLFKIITDADEDIQNLIIVASILGGVGKRARRGFGSFRITRVNGINLPLEDLKSLCERMNRIADKYKVDSGKIVAKNFPPLSYPYIKSIELGAPARSYRELLRKIGEACHQYDCHYTGFAIGKKRFASPIYISIIIDESNKYLPIITTLNTAFEPGFTPGKNLQKDFIGALV
ncbi:MAG: type III-B CRISPR module RAMP protein Cmr1 [Calditrichaeota bacterium]|nr:MAG: type III-B CRISPR module RAMP protein Cmr1 [Calditrichota bacterium]